jgi:signal transduction histidine kinase
MDTFAGMARPVTQLQDGPEPTAEERLAAAEESEVFLATAVHEIRTPATVLLVAAETLQSILGPEQLGPRGAALMATMKRTAGQLHRLFADLLQSAYLERGAIPVHLDILPIRPILGWAADSTGCADDVTIECDPSLHGLFDPDRLQQIVTNLVANAIDHGEPPVALTAALADGGTAFTVTVSDHGPGVLGGEVGHLFDRFGGLAGQTTRSTGLGLSIARALARAMGGDLVYGQAAGTSAFVVTLPTS